MTLLLILMVIFAGLAEVALKRIPFHRKAPVAVRLMELRGTTNAEANISRER